MSQKIKVGVIGSGTMGAGIAQVAAQAGHEVVLFDQNTFALNKAGELYVKIFDRLVEKEKFTREQADEILARIDLSESITHIEDCMLVVEAIIEDLSIKQDLLKKLENLVVSDCVIASNTSSLSIALLASQCEFPDRVIGLHFFNPAPLMPLVEVVPAVSTKEGLADEMKELMLSWNKVPVIAQDTPGFIVNRVARPFYGEALRILEEGIADVPTIDWAMKEIGGFRMGPFELMDYIGRDINYKVTESVFEAFYYDPRYKPSFTQKRLAEAGWLGRKSGRGFYNYEEGAKNPEAIKDQELGIGVYNRILSMLMNEAVDALYLNVASHEDIELAMTKGVNYPKGLLSWAEEIGVEEVYDRMADLYDHYCEDRYRPSPLFRLMLQEGNESFS